jgi:thiamine biosynthesis lipoprotein
MGQPVHLLLWHESETDGLELAQAVLGELRRVEARLSRFDSASDLSELNRHAGRGPMRVDADLLAVLRAAGRCRRLAGGAFNCAVEPLMRLWGFRDPRATGPSDREIAEAREAVSAAEVLIDGDRVSLPAAHTALDLGGIGVGYALDRASEVLRRGGAGAALLDVSGDIITLGAPPGLRGWAVDIADPATPGARIASVRLRDRALATSANTVSVVRLAGRLCGHVMDPVTGFPADRITQASVTAPTGLLADALSTASLVAGRPVAGVEKSWLVGGGG